MGAMNTKSFNVGSCPPSITEKCDDTTTCESKLIKEKSSEENTINKRTEIKLSLSRVFLNDESNGQITRRGVIVATGTFKDANSEIFQNQSDFIAKYPNKYQDIKNDDNPDPYLIEIDMTEQNNIWTFLTTLHQRKKEDQFVDVTVGTDEPTCDGFCNGPLKSGKDYRFKVFVETKGGVSVSITSQAIKTDPNEDWKIGLGVGFAVLFIIAIVLVAVFILRRQRATAKDSNREMKDFSTVSNGKTNDAYNKDDDDDDDEEEDDADDDKPDISPIAVEDFSTYCQTLKRDSGFLSTKQYDYIKAKSPKLVYTVSVKDVNKIKNRWINIHPYDATIVKISSNGQEGSDYINANWMKGYSREKEYIASQGPKAITVNDHWKMLWECNAQVIVMVTHLEEKGKDKCAKYWPDMGEPGKYGDIEVDTKTEKEEPTYTLRLLEAQKGSQKKKMLHYHFTNWPDFGVPDTPQDLVDFVQVVRGGWQPYFNGPMVVHCSAGVGRTGTFICVDIVLQAMRDGKKVDIIGTIMNMRKYRMMMVQTEKQYSYIHDCIKYIIDNKLHLRQPNHVDDDDAVYANVDNNNMYQDENLYANT